MQIQYSPELKWLNYVNFKSGINLTLLGSFGEDVIEPEVFENLAISLALRQNNTFGPVGCCSHLPL